MLSPDERARYDRQIMLEGLGEEGQGKLKNARVLIVGMGGLGCPVALYLAAAGVGEITLADFDRVELSNLNRQVLHWGDDLAELKVRSAADKLKRLNSHTRVRIHEDQLAPEDMIRIVSHHDVVVDALDSLESRHQLNRAAVQNRVPMIYGGIFGMDGMTTWIIPGRTPCLHCLFPRSEPRRIFPVLGTTPGIIGLIQATETIKYLTGMGRLLTGRLLVYDGAEMRFTELSVERDPGCAVCGGVEP